MTPLEEATMRRLRSKTTEVVTLRIKVDPQMYFEVESFRVANNICSFDEAMFRIFELGRQSYRDQLDDSGE